jgi:hypothetical protein
LFNNTYEWEAAYRWYVTIDTTKPTVSAFNVTPLNGTTGQVFTASYTVSDSGGSGLNRVELWRANDSGGSPVESSWTEVKRTTSPKISEAPL